MINSAPLTKYESEVKTLKSANPGRDLILRDLLQTLNQTLSDGEFDCAAALTVKASLNLVELRANKSKHYFVSGDVAKEYFRMYFAKETIEKFAVAFLSQSHQLITVEVLATGTIGAATVFPREVVKAALSHDASAVILSHNLIGATAG